MEILYCTIAFTGFATLFGGGWIKATMELFSFVFMLYLGTRFLTARQLLRNSPIEVRLEEKLNPHSAFMIGFVRVLGNPGVLVFWIILAANFISREWVSADRRGQTGVHQRRGAGNRPLVYWPELCRLTRQGTIERADAGSDGACLGSGAAARGAGSRCQHHLADGSRPAVKEMVHGQTGSANPVANRMNEPVEPDRRWDCGGSGKAQPPPGRGDRRLGICSFKGGQSRDGRTSRPLSEPFAQRFALPFLPKLIQVIRQFGLEFGRIDGLARSQVDNHTAGVGWNKLARFPLRYFEPAPSAVRRADPLPTPAPKGWFARREVV
jgi:hypothetical protein